MEEWKELYNLSRYSVSNTGTISKVLSNKYINKTVGGFKFESIEN